MSWRDKVQFDHYYKVRYIHQGGHIHCRLFSRTAGQSTYASCGEFTLSENEMSSFMQQFPKMEFEEKTDG